MRLSDINGPRGGADKRCHLQVVLAGLPDVVVEDIEADRSYRTRSRQSTRLTSRAEVTNHEQPSHSRREPHPNIHARHQQVNLTPVNDKESSP